VFGDPSLGSDHSPATLRDQPCSTARDNTRLRGDATQVIAS
jgi:hypothetical protein